MTRPPGSDGKRPRPLRPTKRPSADADSVRVDIERSVSAGRDQNGIFITGDHVNFTETHVHVSPGESGQREPFGGASGREPGTGIPRPRSASGQRPAADVGGEEDDDHIERESKPSGGGNGGAGFGIVAFLFVLGVIVSQLQGGGSSAVGPIEAMAVLNDLESARAVAFSADGAALVVTGDSGITRSWDTATRRATMLLPDAAPGGGGRAVLSSDGRTLATSTMNKIRLTEVATGTTVAQITVGNILESVSLMVFSPDGRSLATAGSGDRVRGWEVATGKQTFTVGRGVTASAVAFSPDGTLLAIAGGSGGDRGLRLWNLTTGTPVSGLALESDGYSGRYAVAFSPDGRTLAVTAGNKVRFMDVALGQLTPVTLSVRGGDITDLAFTPDGRVLATASTEAATLLWDVAGGRTFATLTGYEGPVRDVVFSSDGRWLATAGSDRTARLWSVPCATPGVSATGSSSAAPVPPVPCRPAPTGRNDRGA
ncbi:WD40 repeat domain-containing protein [Kitasatospora purpeofusca]|uniref:WD40 repeat domain-containing protein n=1 Tax=Kitasatospora purpeofusca TaxID=67352 RepID=UPI002A5AAFF7|nr:WD40 repeat domain-containing protein [Kitasatospora purpeofusca]MDY0813910.1 WD40 repeat domain-containing protein [Kitasatospora purpeofusca]